MSNEDEEVLALHPKVILGTDDEGHVVCVILDLPKKPAIMGLYLADALRHITNAYCEEDADEGEKAQVAMEIYSVFTAEMAMPTDKPKAITRSGKIKQVRLDVSDDEERS